MLTTFDYTEMGFEKVWLWADLHFGHERVRHNCNRPWKNVDKMEAKLEEAAAIAEAENRRFNERLERVAQRTQHRLTKRPVGNVEDV